MLRGSHVEGDLKLDHLTADVLYCTDMQLSSPSTIGPLNISELADLSNAYFTRPVRMMISASRLSLARASFDRGGRIECKRAKIDLSRLAANAALLIIGDEGSAVSSMEDADCAHLRLSSLDLSDCYFYGCHDLQGITLESTVSLTNAPRPLRSRRRCIADEFTWRAANSRWRKADWSKEHHDGERKAISPPSPVAGSRAAGEIADVYRSLRISVETRSNEPGAADFYYGEMEMRRRDRTVGRADRLIVWTYWLVSGYGLRALRSVFCLVCVFVAGSILMQEFGIKKGHWPTAFIASGQSIIPGLSVSSSLTSSGQAFEIALRIIGPVLLGLGLLALRNRVRR